MDQSAELRQRLKIATGYEKLHLLLALAEVLLPSDAAEVVELSGEAIALAAELEDGHSRVQALLLTGRAKRQLGHPAEAVISLQEARSLQSEHGQGPINADILNELGAAHTKLDQYDQALAVLQEALTVAEKWDIPDARQQTHRLLAELHTARREFEQAVGHYQQMTTLHEMRDKARQIRQRDLEAKLQTRQSELKETLDALQKTQMQLVLTEKRARSSDLASALAQQLSAVLQQSLDTIRTVFSKIEAVTRHYKYEQLTAKHVEALLRYIIESNQTVRQSLQAGQELIQSLTLSPEDKANQLAQKFHLKSLLESVAQGLLTTYADQEIVLSVECDPELVIESYPNAFAQVVGNLISNSLIHGFADQQAGQIIVQAAVKEGLLHLDYRDTGVGIAADVLPQIFGVFFTTAPQKGAGLGLAIVHDLVTKKLEGELDCQSEVDKGVHFTLRIPVKIDDAATTDAESVAVADSDATPPVEPETLKTETGAEPEPSEDDPTPWRVLIADSDAHTHSLIRNALQHVHIFDAPVEFLDAYSADETRRLLQRYYDVAVVLLDENLARAAKADNLFRYFRHDLQNLLTRIVVMRNPAEQDAKTNVIDIEAVDFRLDKSHLTADLLNEPVRVAIKYYRDLKTIDRARHDSEQKLDHQAQEFKENLESLTREIAARRLMEKSLRRLKNAIEAVEVGVTITDVDGTIIYTNPADAAMHGYQVRELVGQHAKIFGLGTGSKPGARESEPNLEQFRNWVREAINVRKDGTRFPVRLISKHIKDASGKLIGIVTVCEDISGRKQSDEDKRLIEQQRDLLRDENQQLIRTITHDLKDPLSVILRTSQMVTQIGQRNFSQTQLEQIFGLIEDMGSRMLNLIDDLSVLNQFEQETIELELHPFDLRFPVNNLISRYQARAAANQVEIHFAFPDDDHMVQADMELTRHVIEHLLENALQWSPAGSTVEVRIDKNDDRIQLEVKDAGPGLTEPEKQNIFRKFFRLNVESNNGNSGAAVNLAVVKKQVEAMHGQIRAESPGRDQGSTIIVILPRYQ